MKKATRVYITRVRFVSVTLLYVLYLGSCFLTGLTATNLSNDHTNGVKGNSQSGKIQVHKRGEKGGASRTYPCRFWYGPFPYKLRVFLWNFENTDEGMSPGNSLSAS